MKKIVLAIFVFSSLSCTQSNDEKQKASYADPGARKVEEANAGEPNFISNIIEIDAYYKNLDPTGLHIHSAFYSPMEEKQIPPIKGFPPYEFECKEGHFAVGKFKFSDEITAYITRGNWDCFGADPMFLSLIENPSNKVVTTLEGVAESSGENDWQFWSESWIEDVNSDGYFDVVQKYSSTRYHEVTETEYVLKCGVVGKVYLYLPVESKFVEAKEYDDKDFSTYKMKFMGSPDGKGNPPDVCGRQAEAIYKVPRTKK